MNEEQDGRWKGSPVKDEGGTCEGEKRRRRRGKDMMTIVKGSLVKGRRRGWCQLTGSPRQVGEMGGVPREGKGDTCEGEKR